jgi:Lysozyme like domain
VADQSPGRTSVVTTQTRDRAAPNSGRRLSNVEIANLARDAGFRDDRPPADAAGARHSELAWAVAIALAESHGDRTAVGHTGGASCGEYVIGLWQICRPTLQNNLFDGAANAQVAFSMYQSRGRRFGGGLFSTFPDPARANLPQAEVAVKGTHRDRPGVTRPSSWPIFGDILDAVGFLVGWITDGQTWIRLGEIVGGAVLVLVGIVLLYLTTKGR